MQPSYTLEDGSGGRAEIWPALGFNCFHWQAVVARRSCSTCLYADPKLFADGRPTRSGIPILFPFPNRIRAGRFRWEGKDYQLPLNDSVKQNAIHGFACRRPWRVVGQGADANAAWLTGEFRGSVDAKDCAGLWPADYELRITYRLTANCLRRRGRGGQSRQGDAALRSRLSPLLPLAVHSRFYGGRLHGHGAGRFLLGPDGLPAERSAPCRRCRARPERGAPLPRPQSRRRAGRSAGA